jgi:hypothetical protein
MNQPNTNGGELAVYADGLRKVLRARATTRSRAERIEMDALRELLMPIMFCEMADALSQIRQSLAKAMPE